MKKYIIIIVLLYIYPNFLLGQSNKYFTENYGEQFIQDGYKIISEENYYFIGGNFFNQDLNKWGTHTLVVDKQGNLLHSEEYDLENKHIGFRDMMKHQDSYILTGFSRPLQDETLTQTLFLQTSTTGNLEILKNNDLDLINSANSIEKALDEGFIFGGEILEGHPDTSFSNLFLAKVSEKGDYEWYKEYHYPYYCYVQKIITNYSNNSYYLLSTINWVAGSGDLLLLNVDTEGNKIWEKVYDLEDEDRARNMIATQDGGFLISGVTDNRPWSYLLKVDELGNIEWKKKMEGMFFASSVSSMVELEDGSYVLTGSNWNYLLGGDKDLAIAKVDKDGNLLWQRFYGGEKNDYGYDIITANNHTDGLEGFVISGRTESLPEPGANVYLVKTNCLGLLTEPQTQFSAEQDSENNLTYHFTNHSQYVYPDSIDGGHFLWDFGDGTTSTDLHPSHEYANKGESYPVTLTAVVCSDTSVFEIKVVSGDEIVGIEEVENLPAFSFKMYPNPTNGKVFLDYDLPKEGLLQLYDLQGKKMGDWELDSQKDNLILDMENLSSGMYVYRLTSEGMFLKGGKLVVE